MLDSSKKKAQGASKILTIIGSGTSVTGEIKSKGTIRIEGHVSGRVHCDDTIVVQDSGRVEADLVAAQIVINGEVKGNVFAHDRLEVATNGKLVGDITAPRVSIAEGVIFEGKCTMKPQGQATPPSSAEKAQQGPSQQPSGNQSSPQQPTGNQSPPQQQS